MAPERNAQDMWFSVAEVSRILGITRQAVYLAINSGHLQVNGEGYGRKIHVQDLLAYGIKTGRDPRDLVNRIQEDTGADTRDMLMWVLAGLGLLILVKGLLNKK